MASTDLIVWDWGRDCSRSNVDVRQVVRIAMDGEESYSLFTSQCLALTWLL
jgi:hypothetical protein